MPRKINHGYIGPVPKTIVLLSRTAHYTTPEVHAIVSDKNEYICNQGLQTCGNW